MKVSRLDFVSARTLHFPEYKNTHNVMGFIENMSESKLSKDRVSQGHFIHLPLFVKTSRLSWCRYFVCPANTGESKNIQVSGRS